MGQLSKGAYQHRIYLVSICPRALLDLPNGVKLIPEPLMESIFSNELDNTRK
jgi:hypothetical protein